MGRLIPFDWQSGSKAKALYPTTPGRIEGRCGRKIDLARSARLPRQGPPLYASWGFSLAEPPAARKSVGSQCARQARQHVTASARFEPARAKPGDTRDTRMTVGVPGWRTDPDNAEAGDHRRNGDARRIVPKGSMTLLCLQEGE